MDPTLMEGCRAFLGHPETVVNRCDKPLQHYVVVVVVVAVILGRRRRCLVSEPLIRIAQALELLSFLETQRAPARESGFRFSRVQGLVGFRGLGFRA